MKCDTLDKLLSTVPSRNFTAALRHKHLKQDSLSHVRSVRININTFVCSYKSNLTSLVKEVL